MASNEYDIAEAFRAIEDELIASMIRNMTRHRAEEETEGMNWTMWQAEQLKHLERYKQANAKKYGTRFASINRQIEELIRQAKETGGTEQEQEILESIKNGFQSYKKSSAGTTAEFFKLNERKLETLIQATTSDMERAETAVLRRANDQYRKVIYNAQVYANTGTGTYEKAVDMATRDMLQAGLTCVEYKNGARHTLADYADMALRTASKRAYLQGEGEKRQEWGISTVIVNKRGNPCPKCLPHCGKVYIDDVWSGGPKTGISPVTGIKYPLLSSAIAAGLYHPRCKDSHTTYFEGISTPPSGSKYAKDELDEIAEQYRREQKQQYAERQEEKFERLAEYSLDEENKKTYWQKKKVWESVAKDTGSGIIKLSEKELGAILKYKSSESYMINDALRRAESVESLSLEQQQFVGVLDSALSKVKTFEGNLIRTVNFSDWPDCTDRNSEFLEEFTPDKTVKIKQYWSTSKEYGYDDNAGIKIFIQDSKKGRDISEVGLNENEVLYERDSEFFVVAKMYVEGVWNILLREV